MTMTETEKTEFVDSYTQALVKSWSDEAFTQRLETEPRAAFSEVGLMIPAQARVAVVRHIPDEPAQAATEDGEGTGHLDRQIALWQVGLDTGYYEVYMPDTPQIDTGDLNLDELADVAGGWELNCCCCPCSCCT
ncbi:MAG TPA: hypothetical protein VFR07_17295 [Mycobacteriales bacterium]|jgi:hypothetical protein|nr:hypothetical protein [Mycobacteriales bacterium]